jgi:flagella basal body P-ring formation protein FlgA
MREKTYTFMIYLIIALLTTTQVAASEFHSLEEIRKSAAEFATRQIGGSDKNTVVESGHLDPRLHLPRCNRPLDATLLGQQRNSPNITVTIKCQGESPWTVHVPVRTSTFAEVFIANRLLPRGVAIQLADLRQERREVGQLSHGYFENAETVVGRMPKRSLPKGAVVSPNDLELNRVIQRGAKVTIIASSGGITVRMPGKALDDAAEGDLIKVENLSSKRIVEAVVLRPGVVEVQM